MGVLREVSVVRRGIGLLSVLEIVPAGVGEFRGDGGDDAGGCPLRDGLLAEDAGGLGRIERRPPDRRRDGGSGLVCASWSSCDLAQ